MCNAWNHRVGCECEFGPPYHKKIKIVGSVPWIDRALADPTAFARAFRDLHLETETRKSLLRSYRTLVSSSLPADTIRARLQNLIARLDYRIEATQMVRLRIPLFRFFSPLPGSTVCCRENLMIARSAGWLVSLQGVGMGSTREVKFTTTDTFTAVDGKGRQVFLPLDVTVHLVGVYDKAGRLKGRGLRAEVKDFQDERTLRARGDEPLPGTQEDIPADEPCDDHYDLLRSSGTTAHRISKEFDMTRDLRIGLKGFGFEVEMPASVRREREIEIESLLPSGHDYRLWLFADALLWRVDEDVPTESLWAFPAVFQNRPAQVFA